MHWSYCRLALSHRYVSLNMVFIGLHNVLVPNRELWAKWTPKNKLLWNFKQNSTIFYPRKSIWKCLQNFVHFVQISMCQAVTISWWLSANCGISIANTEEIPQPCTKPSTGSSQDVWGCRRSPTVWFDLHDDVMTWTHSALLAVLWEEYTIDPGEFSSQRASLVKHYCFQCC